MVSRVELQSCLSRVFSPKIIIYLTLLSHTYGFSANLYGELLCSDHSVLSMILRNSFTVLRYAIGVSTQPTDEHLWGHLSLTCIWPIRHQKSSSQMVKPMSLLSTDSSDDATEPLPEDHMHPQWLYRMTDGEEGRPARTAQVKCMVTNSLNVSK